METWKSQDVITGLPRGMDLKQPNQYSSSELRLLYNCIDNVKFLEIPDLTDQDVAIEQEEVTTSEHEQSSYSQLEDLVMMCMCTRMVYYVFSQ